MEEATTAPLQTTYRYTGQRHEPDIKLYYYIARWYDNRRGRFTQPDTIVPEPANPQSLNRYAYVNNNPVRYTDPSGHFREEELLQYKVFYGPTQMAGTRDHPSLFWWYYLLRAAEFGDKVTFSFIQPMGVHQVTGEFREQEGRLFFVSNRAEFLVTFGGLRVGDTAVLPIFECLEKSEGVVLRSGEALRRYVQIRTGGRHPLTEGDYWEVTVGGYFGFGGYISVKRDRFGRIYVGGGVGIGVGRWGGSVIQGHLLQDYDPNQGQLKWALTGSQVALQVGYYIGGGISPTDLGSLPMQYGFSWPGFSLSIGYSWQIR